MRIDAASDLVHGVSRLAPKALGADFGDLLHMPVTFWQGNGYVFETTLLPSKSPVQGFKSQCAKLEIWITLLIMSTVKQEG